MSIKQFTEWFEQNKKLFEETIAFDREETYLNLYVIWNAGYKAGQDSLKKTITDLEWNANPDRSGGQFADEEIERSKRGGDGW